MSALHLFCIDHQAGQQQGKEDGALLFRISLAVFFLESVVTTHYQENALKISLANPLIHDNKISNGFCVCFCGFV